MVDSPRPSVALDVDALGLEPLSARSLVLSVLLGSHPPKLTGRQLVAVAELFDIRGGTVRTALSRMVASGDLVGDDGDYSLGVRMLQRQRQQDEGRHAPPARWDGRWYTAIAAADARSVAERRAFRAAMVGARMGELRPDIWMRPANIALPDRPEDVLVTWGELDADEPAALLRQLWDLDALQSGATLLLDALERHRPTLDHGDPTVLPDTFMLSAAAVRFLRTEPQLPVELAPDPWAPPDLRPVYDDFEAAFQRLLRAFLRSLTD